MFRSRSWFGGGWGRPKNPHSLEHLKYLYNVLARNQTVSEHNRGLLVESLRCIAEILIWGDQNDSSVFDFFLEKNMLSFFLRIMRQRSGGSSYVCVQLLQTLNILFENIRNETSLYYLLSNNHVNSIIVHKFDFSDEEVMAYYISFLKTLSLKLNAHTIHFFYNEHTNDFPLYTEAIKFFNHPESMVRIAVRTLTLNVYRVEDASMLAFIRDRTAAPYFSNIVWFIGKHILELDACVRNDADHQSQNRLADLVAEHLDHLHYINDILSLNITDLNRVLTEHLLHKLFVPLYINSLRGAPRDDDIRRAPESWDGSQGRVAPVVALFLLSQVFLIITHAPLVRTLAWIILKADGSIFEQKPIASAVMIDDNVVEGKCSIPASSVSGEEEVKACSSTALEQENATDEEKLMVATPSATLPSSPFFDAVMRALDCTENDYTALFALSLLYALANNKGVPNELLDDVLRPTAEATNSNADGGGYNFVLVDRVLQLVTLSCQPTCRVRLVTLELGLRLLLQLVGQRRLAEAHRAAVDSARAHSTALLRNFYKSEEIFLDMFEHEYADMGPSTGAGATSLNVEWLCMDATLLLPPTGTPMTGIAFIKRLPCGEVERARRAIRAYFLVRGACLALADETDAQLPLTNTRALVEPDTVLDLNNSDLISCVVVRRDSHKMRRFLVIDVIQLILVEPDTRRLGWGVVKLVGFLQDVEVVGDKDDSRSLHITVHGPPVPGAARAPPLLAAKFVFDDHIRCMAAKQRLTKGRLKARQKKMQQIARLLDIPGQLGPPSPAHASGLVSATRSVGGRGSRDRPLLSAGRVPGFATPRRESAPIAVDQKREKVNRDGSNSRQRSRDASPRMPRPRSEEIPLELIRRSQAAGTDPQSAAPKISILPRPQENRVPEPECEPTIPSVTTCEVIAATPATSVPAHPNSEETSFIANQDRKTARRKGAIETV